MSGNQIRSLRGLEGHDFLETIDMEDNEVILLDQKYYFMFSPGPKLIKGHWLDIETISLLRELHDVISNILLSIIS